jgi:hypothetical protein
MTEKLHIAMDAVEEAAKLLYIRALKILPDDIKQGFARLDATESDGLARSVLATMIENIAVAERTENLLCQDTGIPIFNVQIGREVELDGWALTQAIAAAPSAPPASTRCAPRSSTPSPAATSTPPAVSACRSSTWISSRPAHAAHRDDPEGLGQRERLLPADADTGRWHRRHQALRGRRGDQGRAARFARRPSSASAWAAPAMCACTWRRSPPPRRSARAARMRKARRLR